jgi:hypothetical protein
VLLEPLEEPVENRIDYIKQHKSSNEIGLRLELLRPVQGKLPNEVAEAGKAYAEAGKAEAGKAHAEAWKAHAEAWKAHAEAGKAYAETWKAHAEAGKAYDEAGKAYDEAWNAYDEARKAYDEATMRYRPKLEALHQQECLDCPWDGKTIFPLRTDPAF